MAVEKKTGIPKVLSKVRGEIGRTRTKLGNVLGRSGTTEEDPRAEAEETPFPDGGRAMVIMAHPDDAEFVCGGTIAKWCAEGWEVVYVIATGGDKGTHDPEMHPEKLAAIREEEQRAACRALGVKECIFLGYPDGFTAESAELRGLIVRLVRQYKPDVVITWDAYERGFNHRDHRNIGVAVADALYPLVRDRLFYPAHEEDGLDSHEVNEILLAGTAKPDFTVDITEHWDKRVEAILCHTSQIGGRTREDFEKMRQEQISRDREPRAVERFRRWSIRRSARRQAEEKAAAAAGA